MHIICIEDYVHTRLRINIIINNNKKIYIKEWKSLLCLGFTFFFCLGYSRVLIVFPFLLAPLAVCACMSTQTTGRFMAFFRFPKFLFTATASGPFGTRSGVRIRIIRSSSTPLFGGGRSGGFIASTWVHSFASNAIKVVTDFHSNISLFSPWIAPRILDNVIGCFGCHVVTHRKDGMVNGLLPTTTLLVKNTTPVMHKRITVGRNGHTDGL